MIKLVILDAGHGADTPGKCSPDKTIMEYAYNRKLVASVAEQLRKNDINVLVLVPENNDISLAERVRRANAAYKQYNKSAILVSVHLNAAGNGQWMQARGWSVFVSPNASVASKNLANALFDAAHANGLKTRQPDSTHKYWTSNLYICRKTNCPAVLTENLFMDNKADKDLLLSDAGFEKLTNTLTQGILTYIKS